MKNADFRYFLEREILRQLNSKNPLSKTQSDIFLSYLFKLHQSNVSAALSQNGIYSATCGDLHQFVRDFLSYVLPVINFYGKSVADTTVLDTKTIITFSPRLAEIAIGSMLRVCLCISDKATLNIKATARHVIIKVGVSGIVRINDEIRCIGKIGALHGGRLICEFSRNRSAINLLLPSIPHFQPLKFVPCSPELCRICRIWNF